jgi:AGZA family xanthine/uracil permease-like MFS transporter
VTSNSLASAIERRFDLTARGSTIPRELLAGLTSFLAAAYLVIVIPSLLTSGGMNHGAITAATIMVLVVGSVAMGIYANLPFIVGPGIGGSVILGVTLAQVDGIPWPVGLGIAFLSGAAFVILTLSGVRGIVVRMVPSQIKLGLGASIGLFIAMVGCRDAGMVALNTKSNALALGDFSQPGVIAALVGLAVAVAMQTRKIPGALIAGIVAATVAGIPLGLTKLPAAPFAAPASIAPVSFALDVPGALVLAALPYLFAFFVAEFFSTLGTTLAVGAKAGPLSPPSARWSAFPQAPRSSNRQRASRRVGAVA